MRSRDDSSIFPMMDILLRRPWLLLSALIIICYANSLSGPFLWDDLRTVVENPVIRGTENIPLVFQTSVFGTPMDATKFYRPLVTLSLFINYTIGGLNPLNYHITNILLHIANTLLVFAILKRLKLTETRALIVSTLFAIHPMGIEVVTFVSGRSDALASCFMLLCIFAFLKSSKNWKWLMLSAASFLCALLSKESAVITPAILLLIVLLFEQQRSKPKIITAISCILLAVCYTTLRITAATGAIHGALSLIAESTLWERILTLPAILFTYARILLWPWPLHMEYHFVTQSILAPSVLFFIAFLMLGTAYYILRRSEEAKKLRSYYLFWLAWIALTLAPVLHIPLAQTSTVREHWLYLPSIGAFVLLTGLPVWKKLSQKSLMIMLTVIILILGGTTIDRNLDWLDPVRLYEHDLQYEPQSFLMWNNLGTEYYQKGRRAEAKHAFEMAITQSPNESYGIAYNNYGVILDDEAQTERAMDFYRKSIELSDYELGYSNLAKSYISQGKPSEAKLVVEKGLEANPYSTRLQQLYVQLSNNPQ